MKKQLMAISLVLLTILTSLAPVQAQSVEEPLVIMENAVSDDSFYYLTEKILEEGTYNAELNRMEYIVESSDETTIFRDANGIEIIRTVYAYYSLNDRQHRVDVIHVKRQGNETWEETIRSYNESHSFTKEYTSNCYRSGEYGYYEYVYVCSKCKHTKKGGVDKIYIGPGTGLPLPYNQNSYIE